MNDTNIQRYWAKSRSTNLFIYEQTYLFKTWWTRLE